MKCIWTDSRELQRCPAAIDMETGIILLNRDVWNDYDRFQQRFIIEHELAHYRYPDYSEIEVDRIALHKVAGTAKRSLKRAVATLYQVGVTDDARIEALYVEALKIDAKYGNRYAMKELEEIDSLPDDDGIINTTIKRKMETITICGYEVSITNILLAIILIQLLKK